MNKRISGYGVAIAATFASLPSNADIIYYPALNEFATTAANNNATILSFNLAGQVATDGSHVANEQFFAAHAYAPATSTFPSNSSKLTFNANGATAAQFDASPLAAGTLIGSGQTAVPNTAEATLMGHLLETKGSWSPGQEAFIGLKFDNSGTPNYGWADITTVNNYTIELNSFAYDNTGGPIAAGSTTPVPEPSQIALLALGATGVMIYQRRRKSSLLAR